MPCPEKYGLCPSVSQPMHLPVHRKHPFGSFLSNHIMILLSLQRERNGLFPLGCIGWQWVLCHVFDHKGSQYKNEANTWIKTGAEKEMLNTKDATWSIELSPTKFCRGLLLPIQIRLTLVVGFVFFPPSLLQRGVY